MANWTENLESTIHSIIKSKTYGNLVSRFPKINYTTEETTTTTTKFPNVYLHLISANESDQDLQGDTINAVLVSIQVDVTSNTTKSDVKDVIYEIVDALKELRFSVTSLPIFTKEDDVHRAIIRARRMIGDEDTL